MLWCCKLCINVLNRVTCLCKENQNGMRSISTLVYTKLSYTSEFTVLHKACAGAWYRIHYSTITRTEHIIYNNLSCLPKQGSAQAQLSSIRTYWNNIYNLLIYVPYLCGIIWNYRCVLIEVIYSMLGTSLREAAKHFTVASRYNSNVSIVCAVL